MTEKDIQKLEEALNEIVHDPNRGSWRESKEQIMAGLSEVGLASLEEFVGWFEGVWE